MTRPNKTDFVLANFPSQTYEKVRWCDTDIQGHVNNQIFATYCEAGRVELKREIGIGITGSGFSTFIARLAIDFHGQLMWPGMVEIGTGIKAVNRSSITYVQAIFQNGQCAASAEVIGVHVDDTGTPSPISDEMRQQLARFMLAS